MHAYFTAHVWLFWFLPVIVTVDSIWASKDHQRQQMWLNDTASSMLTLGSSLFRAGVHKTALTPTWSTTTLNTNVCTIFPLSLCIITPMPRSVQQQEGPSVTRCTVTHGARKGAAQISDSVWCFPSAKCIINLSDGFSLHLESLLTAENNGRNSTPHQSFKTKELVSQHGFPLCFGSRSDQSSGSDFSLRIFLQFPGLSVSGGSKKETHVPCDIAFRERNDRASCSRTPA